MLIGQIELLSQLYGRVLVPPAVLAELMHPVAPKLVQDWAANAPAWAEVRTPKSGLRLQYLDAGEGEAIALAAEIRARRTR